MNDFNLVTVHKRCWQSGGGGYVQCGHFSDKGVLQIRTSALFGAKNFGYFEFMVFPHGQGGEGVWGTADKGEGVIFSQFCADVFYRRPLSNYNSLILFDSNNDTLMVWKSVSFWHPGSKLFHNASSAALSKITRDFLNIQVTGN